VKNTLASHIKREIIAPGYTVSKNIQEKSWEIVESGKVIMYNSSLGVLMNRAAKEFGLDKWESK